MTKGEKRNCKIDLRDFLHGIVEHILKKTEYNTGNGTLKKAKVWEQGKEWKGLFFHTTMVEGGEKQQVIQSCFMIPLFYN